VTVLEELTRVLAPHLRVGIHEAESMRRSLLTSGYSHLFLGIPALRCGISSLKYLVR
jgi:hypothetical protein